MRGLILLAGVALAGASIEYQSGIVWPVPEVVTPGLGSAPPSDAIVLFDGTNLDAWKNGHLWKIEDGVAIIQKKEIWTKESFGDCQIHLEFATPAKVEGKGQARGNSGIKIMGRYEIQILDSFDNPTYPDGSAGALYKQQPPMVNASRGPGEWQTFDIMFTAPRFNGKDLAKPGFVTVLHNGVCVHHHTEMSGTTSYTEPPKYSAHAERLPFMLQFHYNPVRFRNIWVRELTKLEGKLPEKKDTPAEK